ncbi:hypothetical protein FKR81_36035 [Lentzea tibetensis]|uniref:Uncharacterized protein n=1 Tax=Lentzea tibetensis TaxID=2591470 RepID=A0A563EIG7_9PSEU|nr:hypothetical protein [Lentzea tibetensis]TWP46351.1 hypothetical protein FKR81_36035 [Lentzea tibetensis]
MSEQVPEPAKTIRMVRIGGVAAVAVLGMALAGCTSTPGNIGECGKYTDMARNRSEIALVDCSSPDAMYKLVDTVSGRSPACPRGDYVEDTSIRNRKTERRTRKCFVLNVKEGECLNAVGESYVRAQCGGTSRRVSKVVNGQFDAKLCGAGDDTREYSRPALTICISR